MPGDPAILTLHRPFPRTAGCEYELFHFSREGLVALPAGPYNSRRRGPDDVLTRGSTCECSAQDVPCSQRHGRRRRCPAAMGAAQVPRLRGPARPVGQAGDAPFDTVVVLMMENRSFDHLLGWLPRDDGRQEGLRYPDLDGH